MKLMSVVLLAVLAVLGPSAGTALLPEVDSPSPTLGSTPQPTVEQPDDSDNNPDDFTQVGLAVLAPLALGAIVGGSLIVYFIARSRRKKTDDSQPPSSPPRR